MGVADFHDFLVVGRHQNVAEHRAGSQPVEHAHDHGDTGDLPEDLPWQPCRGKAGGDDAQDLHVVNPITPIGARGGRTRYHRPGISERTATQERTMDTLRYDWDAVVSGLNQYLRLRSIPIGMKLYETVEEMEAIPKIRRPKSKHTTDQIVAQARQLGWTVGITMADLVGAQCGAVIGLHPQDAEWLSGKRMAGVW